MKKKRPSKAEWDNIMELLRSGDDDSMQLGISIMETYNVARRVKVTAYKMYKCKIASKSKPNQLFFIYYNQIKNYII